MLSNSVEWCLDSSSGLRNSMNMSGEIHPSLQDVVQKFYDRPHTRFQQPLSNSPFITLTGLQLECDKNLHDTSSFVNLRCDICDIRVTSARILQRHLEGRKHRLRVERKDKIFKCELCDVVANSDIQLNIHLNSTKHKNKIFRRDCAVFTGSSASTIGIWILLLGAACIFVNLLLLFKYMM